MLVLKNTVKCKWPVRNKRVFFQDWGGGGGKSPFLIPQLFIAFHTQIWGKNTENCIKRQYKQKD